MRELAHHLAEVVFGPEINLCGCEDDQMFQDDLGDVIEKLVIGGYVSVYWKRGKGGEKDKISLFTLEYCGKERRLSVLIFFPLIAFFSFLFGSIAQDNIRRFIASIETLDFIMIPFAQLEPVLPEELVLLEQHRVQRQGTAPTKRPSPRWIGCRGLGRVETEEPPVTKNMTRVIW
jgi:hypothetical protein